MLAFPTTTVRKVEKQNSAELPQNTGQALAQAQIAKEASKGAAAAKRAATKEQKHAVKSIAGAFALADLSSMHLSELSASLSPLAACS
jgi:hypothetical protein